MKQFKFLGLGRGTLGIHFYHDDFCILEVFMFHGFFLLHGILCVLVSEMHSVFGGGNSRVFLKPDFFFPAGY